MCACEWSSSLACIEVLRCSHSSFIIWSSHSGFVVSLPHMIAEPLTSWSLLIVRRVLVGKRPNTRHKTVCKETRFEIRVCNTFLTIKQNSARKNRFIWKFIFLLYYYYRNYICCYILLPRVNYLVVRMRLLRTFSCFWMAPYGLWML